MTDNVDTNGWSKYQVHVMQELKRNDGDHKIMEEKLEIILTSLATLKVKSGIWGAVAGLIPSVTVLIYVLVR